MESADDQPGETEEPEKRAHVPPEQCQDKSQDREGCKKPRGRLQGEVTYTDRLHRREACQEQDNANRKDAESYEAGQEDRG